MSTTNFAIEFVPFSRDLLIARCLCSTFTSYQTIAKHVMNIHMNRPTGSETIGEIDVDKMKRYIAYCKTYVFSFSLLVD